jgi:hypothetical protein
MHNMETPAQESELAHLPHLHRRLLAGCAAATVVLGTIGFLQYQHEEHAGTSFSNALYHAVQLFALHTPHFERPVPWALEFGHWLGAASTFLAVFGVARRMFHEEHTALRLRRTKGHVIVCGLGRKGIEVVRRLRHQKQQVVVIERLPQPEAVEACRELGACVVTGDATNPDVLRQARVERALSLIALCPDDSTNCEIVANASRLLAAAKGTSTPLQCRVQVGDPEARRTLQAWLAQHKGMRGTLIRFFDTFDPEVRRLLIHELPIDHDGIKPGDRRQVHLIILGFGRMGRTLAVRAAQLGVFAQPGRLKISVIDRGAEVHRKELLFHHPYIGDVCDIEFHQLEGISPETRKFLKDWCARRDAVTSVAVCFDNEQRALEISVQLGQLVETNDVRLAVRMSGRSGLAHLMKAAGAAPEAVRNLRPFGMEERPGESGSLGDDAGEQFARQIHTAYVEMRKREAGQDTTKFERLAHDPALRDWNALAEDFLESNRQQADHIHIKLRALGLEVTDASDSRPAVTELTRDQVEMLAEMEHRRWLAERRIANWTYAPVKNELRRENPNLIAWEKLAESTKDYDRIAVRAIPTLLAGAGKKICNKKVQGDKPKASGS